ncbi:hypothetical protein [Roseinatronobacter sp. S2]|uniref:hypothetical protein n=1 Tax=Roseinatronobacter sp. S2 TaxID=3035471 RepID=UPI0024100D5D|nr:hypothetical protein [Roseinatronobacter sp. S2]WFE74247.1 hypothetical protein P8S53_13805 [Roseinatronobacter sp. S2]
MLDDSDNLFLKSDFHFAARIAQSRIDAIDASPRLHWAVTVQGLDAPLTFDTHPDHAQIIAAARDAGVYGFVRVLRVGVGQKRPRPLLLMPWQRVRS